MVDSQLKASVEIPPVYSAKVSETCALSENRTALEVMEESVCFRKRNTCKCHFWDGIVLNFFPIYFDYVYEKNPVEILKVKLTRLDFIT